MAREEERVMVRIEVVYQGELRCLATHGPSGKTLVTDAPTDNHGRGEAFSPTDLVATALAVCIPTIMGIYAQGKGISLEGLRIRVDKISAETPRHRPLRLDQHARRLSPTSAGRRGASEPPRRACTVDERW
jgi:uncharacterized OsmC-like protein